VKIALIILFFAAGCFGQTTTAEAPKSSPMFRVVEAELLSQLCGMSPNHARCAGRNPIQEMTDAYLEIIKEKTDANKLISRAAEKGITNLLLVIAAQNQRIIELLEEKKK
jgi:hypothetical protein